MLPPQSRFPLGAKTANQLNAQKVVYRKAQGGITAQPHSTAFDKYLKPDSGEKLLGPSRIPTLVKDSQLFAPGSPPERGPDVVHTGHGHGGHPAHFLSAYNLL